MSKKPNAYQTLMRLSSKTSLQPKCNYTNNNGKRCDKPAINSHTVQKGGTLAAIQQNGHVYEIRSDPTSNETNSHSFEKIGWKKASVFPGFCRDHDQQVFRDLELHSGELTETDHLLLGYRSICQELYNKELWHRVYQSDEMQEH